MIETTKINLITYEIGAGESGKSTIFKQMKIIYGEKYTHEDLVGITPVVYNNTIASMKVLVEQVHALGLFKDVSKKAKKQSEKLMEVDDDAVIDGKIGAIISTLWKDEAVQATFTRRNEFQLNDCAKYYFSKIDTIMQDDYVATVDDMLRSRVRTSGIVEEVYTIDGVVFVMYDVGGQRNERKKWIHCFDNVTAVIFVVAISEYDQVLYEDATVNRMEEALNLFDEICNSKWFLETSMILFLNKTDLFDEKLVLPGKDIKNWFPDYLGGSDSVSGRRYFKEKFQALNKSKMKEIYAHCTCATNTRNVKMVFNSCTEIIMRANLRGSGFYGQQQ